MSIHIFEGTLSHFRTKLLTNELFADLEKNFLTTIGHTVSPSEASSWRNSLPRLEAILRLANLPDDVYIVLEERIPYYSKRIDVVLFGHTADGQAYSVIIELKGWVVATATADGNVQTPLGRTLREEPHPSVQVSGYREHLEDFRRIYQQPKSAVIASCSYCHNYSGTIPDVGLFHPQFDSVRLFSPVFAEHDAAAMANFLNVRLSGGNGKPVLDLYNNLGIGPSKPLIEHAHTMMRSQNTFRLLDEQIAANNAIVYAVKMAAKSPSKQVIMVCGGPGTGKSVIALNALGELLDKKLNVYLVSGSSAFTNGMRRILGTRLDGLVRFTDFFWDSEPDSIDALIIDEAHRIRAKSQPKVKGYLRPSIGQVEELIRAARVTIFFVDENQIISPDEVGAPDIIRNTAFRLNTNYNEFHLTSQFRCNGSDVYLQWLDDVLGLTNNHEGIKLLTPIGFDFKIVGSPHQLLNEVQNKNKHLPNSARLLAGWCWPWSDPMPDSLVKDIRIGDFEIPWESKNGKKPPPGIPEAKFWAIDPAGVDQVGTVYSVQGFESQHIGVIIGPDLINRNNIWIAQPKNNFRRSIRSLPPQSALPYLKRIYRTLLSRATKSCSIYCTDAETANYLENYLVNGQG